MVTTVINIKDAPSDWRYNPKYLYIGRPSMWGNPFSVKEFGREQCIEKYREWVLTQQNIIKNINYLCNKILVCYCKPLSCHGDVLIELINQNIGKNKDKS